MGRVKSELAWDDIEARKAAFDGVAPCAPEGSPAMAQIHNETPSAQNKRLKAELASEMALVADLVEALKTARDYVNDAAAGHLVYAADRSSVSPDMVRDDLERIDAALKQANGKGL